MDAGASSTATEHVQAELAISTVEELAAALAGVPLETQARLVHHLQESSARGSELTISVVNIPGNIILGPKTVAASAPLLVLQDAVAEKLGVPPPAVQLVHQDRVLQGSLAEEAVPNESVIKCVLDMMKGQIETSIENVRASLEKRNGEKMKRGLWHLERLVGEAFVPNEEHCPELRNLDWAKLEYKELTFVDTEKEVDNAAGKFHQIQREFYFGTVDPSGAPAGYGCILKETFYWGHTIRGYDGRGAFHGFFLPADSYKMPMCESCPSRLVQGEYKRADSCDNWRTELSGLFDGTEVFEE